MLGRIATSCRTLDVKSRTGQTRYPDPKPSTVHETGASPPLISGTGNRISKFTYNKQFR
jgi:hypothetical protein